MTRHWTLALVGLAKTSSSVRWCYRFIGKQCRKSVLFSRRRSPNYTLPELAQQRDLSVASRRSNQLQIQRHEDTVRIGLVVGKAAEAQDRLDEITL